MILQTNCVILTHLTLKISNLFKIYQNLRVIEPKRFSFEGQRFGLEPHRFGLTINCFGLEVNRSGLTINQSGPLTQ